VYCSNYCTEVKDVEMSKSNKVVTSPAESGFLRAVDTYGTMIEDRPPGFKGRDKKPFRNEWWEIAARFHFEAQKH
jgi:hypothetical protein